MGSSIFSSQSNERELSTILVAGLGVIVFMALFVWESKIYDLSTAMFFSFGLALIARGKFDQYFAVFAFACVNRETAFLLAIIFAVYFLGQVRWWGYVLSVGYQLYLFGAIRLCTVVIFADRPGSSMWVRPIENLLLFWMSPLGTIVHWWILACVVWIFVRRWRSTPRLVRVAFAVMMPLLLVMYLVLGKSFEMRAFAEVFPVVWWMVAGFRHEEIGEQCDCGIKGQ